MHGRTGSDGDEKKRRKKKRSTTRSKSVRIESPEGGPGNQGGEPKRPQSVQYPKAGSVANGGVSMASTTSSDQPLETSRPRRAKPFALHFNKTFFMHLTEENRWLHQSVVKKYNGEGEVKFNQLLYPKLLTYLIPELEKLRQGEHRDVLCQDWDSTRSSAWEGPNQNNHTDNDYHHVYIQAIRAQDKGRKFQITVTLSHLTYSHKGEVHLVFDLVKKALLFRQEDAEQMPFLALEHYGPHRIFYPTNYYEMIFQGWRDQLEPFKRDDSGEEREWALSFETNMRELVQGWSNAESSITKIEQIKQYLASTTKIKTGVFGQVDSHKAWLVATRAFIQGHLQSFFMGRFYIQYEKCQAMELSDYRSQLLADMDDVLEGRKTIIDFLVSISEIPALDKIKQELQSWVLNVYLRLFTMKDPLQLQAVLQQLSVTDYDQLVRAIGREAFEKQLLAAIRDWVLSGRVECLAFHRQRHTHARHIVGLVRGQLRCTTYQEVDDPLRNALDAVIVGLGIEDNLARLPDSSDYARLITPVDGQSTPREIERILEGYDAIFLPLLKLTGSVNGLVTVLAPALHRRGPEFLFQHVNFLQCCHDWLKRKGIKYLTIDLEIDLGKAKSQIAAAYQRLLIEVSKLMAESMSWIVALGDYESHLKDALGHQFLLNLLVAMQQQGQLASELRTLNRACEEAINACYARKFQRMLDNKQYDGVMPLLLGDDHVIFQARQYPNKHSHFLPQLTKALADYFKHLLGSESHEQERKYDIQAKVIALINAKNQACDGCDDVRTLDDVFFHIKPDHILSAHGEDTLLAAVRALVKAHIWLLMRKHTVDAKALLHSYAERGYVMRLHKYELGSKEEIIAILGEYTKQLSQQHASESKYLNIRDAKWCRALGIDALEIMAANYRNEKVERDLGQLEGAMTQYNEVHRLRFLDTNIGKISPFITQERIDHFNSLVKILKENSDSPPLERQYYASVVARLTFYFCQDRRISGGKDNPEDVKMVDIYMTYYHQCIVLLEKHLNIECKTPQGRGGDAVYYQAGAQSKTLMSKLNENIFRFIQDKKHPFYSAYCAQLHQVVLTIVVPAITPWVESALQKDSDFTPQRLRELCGPIIERLPYPEDPRVPWDEDIAKIYLLCGNSEQINAMHEHFLRLMHWCFEKNHSYSGFAENEEPLTEVVNGQLVKVIQLTGVINAYVKTLRTVLNQDGIAHAHVMGPILESLEETLSTVTVESAQPDTVRMALHSLWLEEGIRAYIAKIVLKYGNLQLRGQYHLWFQVDNLMVFLQMLIEQTQRMLSSADDKTLAVISHIPDNLDHITQIQKTQLLDLIKTMLDGFGFSNRAQTCDLTTVSSLIRSKGNLYIWLMHQLLVDVWQPIYNAMDMLERKSYTETGEELASLDHFLATRLMVEAYSRFSVALCEGEKNLNQAGHGTHSSSLINLSERMVSGSLPNILSFVKVGPPLPRCMDLTLTQVYMAHHHRSERLDPKLTSIVEIWALQRRVFSVTRSRDDIKAIMGELPGAPKIGEMKRPEALQNLAERPLHQVLLADLLFILLPHWNRWTGRLKEYRISRMLLESAIADLEEGGSIDTKLSHLGKTNKNTAMKLVLLLFNIREAISSLKSVDDFKEKLKIFKEVLEQLSERELVQKLESFDIKVTNYWEANICENIQIREVMDEVTARRFMQLAEVLGDRLNIRYIQIQLARRFMELHCKEPGFPKDKAEFPKPACFIFCKTLLTMSTILRGVALDSHNIFKTRVSRLLQFVFNPKILEKQLNKDDAHHIMLCITHLCDVAIAMGISGDTIHSKDISLHFRTLKIVPRDRGWLICTRKIAGPDDNAMVAMRDYMVRVMGFGSFGQQALMFLEIIKAYQDAEKQGQDHLKTFKESVQPLMRLLEPTDKRDTLATLQLALIKSTVRIGNVSKAIAEISLFTEEYLPILIAAYEAFMQADINADLPGKDFAKLMQWHLSLVNRVKLVQSQAAASQTVDSSGEDSEGEGGSATSQGETAQLDFCALELLMAINSTCYHNLVTAIDDTNNHPDIKSRCALRLLHLILLPGNASCFSVSSEGIDIQGGAMATQRPVNPVAMVEKVKALLDQFHTQNDDKFSRVVFRAYWPFSKSERDDFSQILFAALSQHVFITERERLPKFHPDSQTNVVANLSMFAQTREEREQNHAAWITEADVATSHGYHHGGLHHRRGQGGSTVVVVRPQRRSNGSATSAGTTPKDVPERKEKRR